MASETLVIFDKTSNFAIYSALMCAVAYADDVKNRSRNSLYECILAMFFVMYLLPFPRFVSITY